MKLFSVCQTVFEDQSFLHDVNLFLTAIFLQGEDGLELPALEHGDSMIAVAIDHTHSTIYVIVKASMTRDISLQGQLEE